jgi:hypothetical protein
MVTAADLHRLSENDRIKLIGESVMNAPAGSGDKPPMNGFIVETEEKADRYIAKLLKRFPGIRIIDRQPGPVVGTILVRVGPPLR